MASNKNKNKNTYQRVVVLLILMTVAIVDILPLMGYAVDMKSNKGEVNEEQVVEIEDGQDIGIDEQGLEEIEIDLEIEEDEREVEIEDEHEIGEELFQEGYGEGETEEVVTQENEIIEEGSTEIEGEGVQEPQPQTFMAMTEQSTPTYVLAKDSDFTGSNGSFRYVGNDDYVEIPHTIKGVNVTSYSNMFRETSVKGVKSTNKNVHNMGYMFYSMETPTIDVSQLDTSGVTNMVGMFAESFRDVYTLRQITGLERFDTRQVRDMSSMFSNSKVTSVNMSNFKVPYLTTIASMFSHSSARELDFRGFNTSNVTSLSSLFYSSSVSVVKGIESFDTSNVTNMSSVFYATPNLREVDVSNFNTSKVTDMTRMFFNSGARYLDLRSFDTSKVTRMDNMFQSSKATTIDGLENFDTSRVTDMTAMFSNAQASKLDLRSFDTSKITNMVSMFESSGATEILIGGSFDTSKVTNMSRMFRNAKASRLDVSMFNTSRVTTMERMFELSQATTLDLRNFNTQRVTNMERMFEDSHATSININNFDTTYVTTMRQMFNKARVKELDLSSFDMRSVNETHGLLANTTITKAVSKSQGDADKLNNTEGKPTNLTFKPKYKVAKDTDFIGTVNGSFRYVGTEDYVEMPNQIRGVSINSYRKMFEGTSVEGVISTNPNIMDMSEMFKNTTSTELDVSTITTNKVTDMSGMFEGSKATSLDLRNFVTVNVANMSNMFKGTNVKEIDMGSFNMEKTINTENMFQDTKASKGYVRSDAELGKVSNSTNKPTHLAFTVWGITVTSNPSGWTNGMVDLEVETKSGNTTIRETELVNNEGENILKSKHFRPHAVNPYSGARVTVAQNVSMPEWGVSDAIRVSTIRGNGDFQFHWGVTDTSQWLGMQATHSVYIKNEGKGRLLFSHNGLSGAINHWINQGESKRVVSTGIFRTSHSFIQFHVRSSEDVKAVFWGHKLELGASATEYTPPLETTTEEGVFPVYNNGTYIFRSTDSRGEVRTVAYTVNNIDRVNPTADITPSTSGQTSQDVTLYVKAKDNLSGVDYITLPDGKRVNGDEAEYLAKENKDYVFKITDKAGNIESITHKVSNIDRSLVVVTATVDNKNWTRDPVNITVTSEESASKLLDIKMVNSPYTPAPEDIKLINNSKTYPVIANGLYTFRASYENGVTSEVSVNISNIDLDAPTVTVINNPEDWTEEDEVELEINITDNNQSGVKVITMPDGTTTTGTSLKYKVTENGEYSFTVEDNIGNKETHVITVDKLMIPYFFYIYDGNGEPLEGAGFELLRAGVAHARTESDVNGLVDFGKVPPTGKYTIRQTKAPDGYIVDPEEKDVDVEDETDPIEIINYPRGEELPSTGTMDMVVLGSIIIITVIGMYVIKRIKDK